MPRVPDFYARSLFAAVLLLLSPTSPFAAEPERSATIGASTSLLGEGVSVQDFTLDPPGRGGGSIFAPNFGYAHQFQVDKAVPGNPASLQMPMFEPFNRDNDAWWDEQLDELLYSRSSVVMLLTRGCFKPEDPRDDLGPGNMCPHLLRKMVAAMDRAGARSALRFALFYDTGALNDARSHTLKLPHTNTKYDFDLDPAPDAAGHAPLYYLWDAGIKPWFDTVPSQFWYLYNDHGVAKPVIAFWGLGDHFLHKQGNLRPLLEEIRERFEAAYHLTPFFLLTQDWIQNDPSLADSGDLVGGVEGWFAPRFGDVHGDKAVAHWRDNKWVWDGPRNGLSTMTQWRGKLWGMATPAYSCGATCGIPIVDRDSGRNFLKAMALTRPAAFTIVEAFNGPLEGNGLMRSDDPHLEYANEYLDLLREFNDPDLSSLKLEAVAADLFNQRTPKPHTTFRYGKSIGAIPLGAADHGVGWALGYTAAGESFSFVNVATPAASYKFTLRASSAAEAHRVHLEIDGRGLPAVQIPPTGSLDRYIVVGLGSAALTRAPHDLKIVLEDGGVNVDWLFMKKQAKRP